MSTDCLVCGEPMYVGDYCLTIAKREQLHRECYEELCKQGSNVFLERLLQRIECLEEEQKGKPE